MALETAESFWNLVCKERFLKPKDFALKCSSQFGNMCMRVHFLRWNKANLKTEI